VKTLPQHRVDLDKRKFSDEIDLMKKIGYHIHLVSMLGCNCSIERPILVMELAEQDLLHWLISNERETETVLEKTLVSICWQISDGMVH
jgi:serine/threonine protein kinase